MTPPPGWAAAAPALLLIAILLLGPILYVFVLSFAKDGISFELYGRILTSPAYRVPILNTFVIATLVTLGCIAAAYPLAYMMATLGPNAARIIAALLVAAVSPSHAPRAWASMSGVRSPAR